MKNILSLLTALTVSVLSIAQSSTKVKWTFTAVKKGDKYEVQLKAKIDNKYHLYSQQAGSGMGLPTKINFNKNPLLSLDGKIKEVGKLITAKEKVGTETVSTKYYANTVTFTQLVKPKTKTNISGNIKFMVCDDKSCLAPSTVSFDIDLN
jgi:hypothetical protein